MSDLAHESFFGDRIDLEVPFDPEGDFAGLEDPDHAQREALLDRLTREEPVFSSPPVRIGEVEDMAAFSAPIREQATRFNEYASIAVDHDRGVAQYQLPRVLGQFSTAIAMIASHEHAMFPSDAPTKAYLSVHQSVVGEGQAQRRAASMIHRDGEPGQGRPWAWYRSYIVTDNEPTLFYTDVESGAPYLEHGETLPGATVVRGNPGEIIRANPTNLHQAPSMAETGRRTFLRLRYVEL